MMRRANLAIGIGLTALVVLTGLLSLFWTPFDPYAVEPTQRLQRPSLTHWLGTDNLGADVLSRMMIGARMCLYVGVISVTIAAVIGIPLGLVSAMAENGPLRLLGRFVLRVSDLLYAFPAVLLAILLAAALGGSTVTAMVAIGVSTIPVFTRITRGAALQVLSQDYIPAARSSGTSWGKIAVRHVLPNIAPLIGVQLSISFATAILAEAALSYLGLGTPVTTATWGRMLYEARPLIYSHSWLVLEPAVAIAVAVLGFNLLGDGLRDHLDPRLREVS